MHTRFSSNRFHPAGIVLIFLWVMLLIYAAGAEEITPEYPYKEIEGTGNIRSGFVYSDRMLLGDSSTFSSDLVKASAVLADAAYSSAASTMLEEMGYKDIQYKVTPTLTLQDNDYAGFTVGYKDVDGTNIRIWAIFIRGTMENCEWFSDFNLGEDNEGIHQGFNRAANDIEKQLSKIITGEGKQIKFWFTGHSRGAAIANILAARFSGDYGASNVFAYTFACPAVSKKANTNMTNIFNINNSGDLIPTLPLESWDYKRNGITREYAFGANPYFVDVSGKYGGVNDHIAYTIILQNLIPSEEDYHDPVRRMAVNILAYALGGKNDVSWQEFTAFFLQDFALYEIEQTILESGGPISLANDLLELCNTRDETAALITDTISITQNMDEDEFAEYLHNNVPRFTKIAKATGHVIENFADLPEALQIILEYSGAAWSVGEIIGCAMDLCQTTGSVFKIVDAIWDAHKPASYVRFINATFYGYNGLSGTDVSSAAASVYTSEITTIGKNCFADCKSLTSVDLKNVKYISTNAFLRCSSLPNLEIPDTVEAIGKHAFAGLTGLKDLKLPVEYFINQDIFYYDDGHGPWTVPNLEQVTVTAGSTGRMANLASSSYVSKTIAGMSAAALTSVILEEGVTSIGDYAFYDYHKNSGNAESFTISLPSTLTSIGKLAFYRHKLTGELVLPEGLMSLGSSAFQEAVGITGIIIPSTLSEIPSLAFFSASGVPSLIIPDTVETIGSGAFAGMYNLISLTLPVEHFLSTNAFYYDNGAISGTVPNLKQVTVTAGWTGRMANLASSSYVSKTIAGMSAAALTHVILEEGITNIGNYAFNYYQQSGSVCCGIDVTIPKTVSSIGSYAFRNRVFSVSPLIPPFVETIGSGTFEGIGVPVIVYPYSTALDYVTSNNISYTLAACKIYSFPDMLTNIESEALMNTPAEIIILPNTNISIGERAFSNSNIYAVVVTGDIISAEVNAFEGCGKIIFIADADSNAAVWAEANGYTVKQAD